MSTETVCPFLDRGEEFCDVGHDYISPHDVAMMVHFCNSRFRECAKFQELEDRFPTTARTRTSASRPAAEFPRTGSSLPASMRCPAKPVIAPFRRARWPLAFRLQCVTNRARTSASRPFDRSFNPHSVHSMKEERAMTAKPSYRKGWTVVLAGTGINLALGILYTWSIFKGAIGDSIKAGGPGAFNWDPASINDPYATACLVFAVAMILAGKFQDKFGPKLTCVLGGLLVGAGFFWISQTTDYWSWVMGFGVLAGMGIGFGYSAATPPALKWFPPAKTGLIAGIVVSGFGLASVYIAPLAKYLLGAYGLQQSMLFFGIAFAIVVSLFGLLLSNPPAGFVADPRAASGPAKTESSNDLTPKEVLRSGKFYTLWMTFFIGAGAGLMVIGSAKGLAKASLGEMAFLVVAIMSIGNAAGRLVAGSVSDKIGRANTLMIMLAFQATLMFAAIPMVNGQISNPLLVTLLVTFMVFNYGTNLALFPSFAKDYWGLKNFGMNYGILFSAWGVGAFVLVRLSEMLKVKTGGFTTSFAAAGILLLVGAMFASSLRPTRAKVPMAAPAFADAEEDDLVLQKVSE